MQASRSGGAGGLVSLLATLLLAASCMRAPRALAVSSVQYLEGGVKLSSDHYGADSSMLLYNTTGSVYLYRVQHVTKSLGSDAEIELLVQTRGAIGACWVDAIQVGRRSFCKSPPEVVTSYLKFFGNLGTSAGYKCPLAKGTYKVTKYTPSKADLAAMKSVIPGEQRVTFSLYRHGQVEAAATGNIHIIVY